MSRRPSDLSQVSSRAWGLVVVGTIFIFLATCGVVGFDSVGVAHWSTFPWLAGFGFLCGLVVLLASTNADRGTFQGPAGHARLLRNATAITLLLTVTGGAAVCVAIVQHRTVAEAVRYALFTLTLSQALALVASRFLKK